MVGKLTRVTLCLLALVMAGCSVNPVTGEQELTLISTEQEVAIGEQNYVPSQQSQGGQYAIDPTVQAYVALVGNKLARVSDAPNLPYEFVVLNNAVPNAWALPGGKIAINRGLLTLLNDESELAAVLGHEIVHAAARHGAAQMTRGMFIGLGAQVATVAAQAEGYGQLAGLAAQLGGGAWMAKYGRDDELESDHYGMEYMARAGYSPDGAVQLQQLFVKLKGGKTEDFLSQLFASHPPSQARVNANTARAGTLPKGQKYKSRYQQNIAQLRKDEAAYAAQEKAQTALEEKRAKVALSHLDKAISIQPREGQFWELRGHAWAMLGNTAKAEKAFNTAIKRSPGYYSPRLYRGLLRYERGKTNSAYGDLNASYKLLPTEAAAYYLGEISLARGDRQQALNFYRNASTGEGDLSDRAQIKMIDLELSEKPEKYVLSKPVVAQNGYLNIALKNNSPIAVVGVRVEVVQMLDSYTAGKTSTLRGSYSLSPGQQKVIKTRIGPLGEASEVEDYRVRVVAARPASQKEKR
ncbi:MAG: M48 family metalloprotease [Halieaceae bacterium]|jgi:beta-barrel assembly-enhancing protease|nr:M48 family metalloprotease [Halieaceae bacterium]